MRHRQENDDREDFNAASISRAAHRWRFAPWPPTTAHAQAWPEKQIFFVVPFAAGGGTDAFARPLAAKIEKSLGARILIENKPGAGGTSGAAAAAKAAPDGYTFLVGAAHHSIAPSIYTKLSYDIETDFIPVMIIAQPPHAVVIHPEKVKARSLKDLIAEIAANPDKMTYASAGVGTTHHMAGELFKIITKTKMAHVPYRGAGPAMQDLIAGHVNMIFDGLGTAAPAIQGGQILGLAVTAPKRVAAFPNMPTVGEAGLPGFEFSTWYALWAPKGTPAADRRQAHRGGPQGVRRAGYQAALGAQRQRDPHARRARSSASFSSSRSTAGPRS